MAIAAVLSAVEVSGQPGWPTVRPHSCRCPTFTSFSPCPTNSARWSWATANACISCFSTCQGDSPGTGRRPQASGSTDRRADGPAHLGQKLEHHPHVHCVVPGGGLAVSSKTSGTSISAAGDQEPRWVSCRHNWFLSVRVLSRLFRGKYLAALRKAYQAGQLQFAAAPRPWRTQRHGTN